MKVGWQRIKRWLGWSSWRRDPEREASTNAQVSGADGQPWPGKR